MHRLRSFVIRIPRRPCGRLSSRAGARENAKTRWVSRALEV